MKIAVISDIHANMQALESVLDDIKFENCKKIFCLGDLAMAGPQPKETIAKIQTLLEQGNFELIQGNTDDLIGNFNNEKLEQVKNFNRIMSNALQDDIKFLTKEEKSFLANLPSCKNIEINNIKILLAHGSPRKNNENIFPNLPLEKIEEAISGTNADIIFVGHTHQPCGYQTNTKQTVVNVGSVGRPLTETPQACYAILDIDEKKEKTFSIRHCFVKYDNNKAAEIMKKRSFNGADKIAQTLLKPLERYPQ